jgi:hypothetical protein
VRAVHTEQGHSISYLSKYFGYSRDGYYKSQIKQNTTTLNKEIIIKSAQEIRRQHPRMGGKKLYYVLGDLTKELHVGRDETLFISYLLDGDCNKKICFRKTSEAY